MKKLLFLVLFSIPLCAQTVNPTQIRWPEVTGTINPAPPLWPCSNSNYGQPYTNTTTDVQFVCAAGGWTAVGATNGTVQPTPQFRLFIQPNTGTQSIAGPATTSQNATTPILQGTANTDFFATGGGNNGVANFLAANPSGLGLVPPNSTSTETPDLPVTSGALIQDRRGNGNTVTTLNVGTNHDCFANTPAYDTECSNDTWTLARLSQNHESHELVAAGPGFSLGNNGTSAQGWSGTTGNYQHMLLNSRGIKSGYTAFIDSHAIGDLNPFRQYISTDGGRTAASDEGAVGLYSSTQENSTYFHGTIVSGGSTGSILLTTAETSGQNYFTDGGFLLDITKGGTLTGTVSSVASTTFGTVAQTFNYWNLTGITMPVSTAWGTANTATTSTANGQFQVYVSQTINFTLGTSPASPGSFVVGNNACIVQGLGVGSPGAGEQVPITAVGTTSGGIQSVTFSTRYGWSAGFVLMQGGMCGQYPTTTGATWRTAIQAIGSLSPTQVVWSACSNGGCQDLSLAKNIADVGGSVTFYPGAEIIGTQGNTPNTTQLANNTTAWANGDSIEGPHPASVLLLGANIRVGQTTKVGGAPSSIATFANEGPAAIGDGIEISTQSALGGAAIHVTDDGTGLGSTVYGVQFSYLNPAVIIGMTNQAAANFRIFEGPISTADNVNRFWSEATGGFLFQEGTNYARLFASNVPADPTALAQIPIVTNMTAGAVHYNPVTLTGDATVDSTGVVAVSKIAGVPLSGLCQTSGAGCPAAAGGVTSIDTLTGAFTFSGSGVSHVGNAYTFSGSGSGIGSITWALPSWLTASPATISASGTQTFSATTGQTANQFLATPNGTTGAVGLRSIVAADIPTLNQSTTGNAATATALASTPTNCGAGVAATGVGANGNAVGCFTPTGTGTVTAVSVVTANGVSGTVATATTTPAITLTLGAITPTSTNGVSAATMAFVDPTSSIQTQLNGKVSGASLTTNVLPKATAPSIVGNSLLTDDGTSATYSGTGGVKAAQFTGTGTTPSALSLPAGAGSIPALPANSAGLAAPATGGTSYLLKLPATITQGILRVAAPATNDGVNESAVTSISSTRTLGWSFGDVATGAALTTSEVGYITVPFACTVTGWHIMADAGTVTVKTARVNGGTALPTIGSNSISTSGVSLASGTKIDSTTTTDFTSTAIAQNDTLGFFITAVATAKQVTFQLDCAQ